MKQLLSFSIGCCLLAGTASGLQQQNTGVRLILVESEAEAADLRLRIDQGESFAELARTHSIDPSAATGGYLGNFDVGDLREEFQEALAGVAPGDVGPVTRVGNAYGLLQRLGPREQDWIGQRDAGLEAFRQGRFADALPYFEIAAELAERLVPTDYRLAQSLNHLASVLERQGDYAAAEPLYERSLEVLEATRAGVDPDIAVGLGNLAGIRSLQGDLALAEPLYRQAFQIREQLHGVDHPDVVRSLRSLASVLFSQQKYVEAEPLYRRLLETSERSLGPGHMDLVPDLDNLATLLEIQGEYPEAEMLFRRALENLERAEGPFHPDVADALGKLAALNQARGRYPEAIELYERALAAMWRVPPRERRGMMDVLAHFTDVFRLTHFKDDEFQDARRAFRESLNDTLFELDFLLALGGLLEAGGLSVEAEAPLERAVAAFPNSRRAHLELGELYESLRRFKQALERFEAASQIPAPRGTDPAVDRALRSLLHGKIGVAHVNLIELSEALQSFERAIEIDSSNLGAIVWIGDVHLRLDERDEAVAAYERVVSRDPGNVGAHVGLAEVYRMRADFPASAAAAEEALKHDPGHARARYLRATAWVGMGRTEEGRVELDDYRRSEADKRLASDSTREEYVSFLETSRAATSELVRGQPDAAIRRFQQALRSHPESSLLRFNLAVAQSKAGRHAGALETLQSLVDDDPRADFVVHRSLALAYERLGDAEASQRHQSIFLERLMDELESALN